MLPKWWFDSVQEIKKWEGRSTSQVVLQSWAWSGSKCTQFSLCWFYIIWIEQMQNMAIFVHLKIVDSTNYAYDDSDTVARTTSWSFQKDDSEWAQRLEIYFSILYFSLGISHALDCNLTPNTRSWSDVAYDNFLARFLTNVSSGEFGSRQQKTYEKMHSIYFSMNLLYFAS